MIAVSRSSWGFNLGLSNFGAQVDARNIGVSGLGFGLVRGCVMSVWYREMHVRAVALDAKDPGLEFRLRFQPRLLKQKVAELRRVVGNPLFFCLFVFKSLLFRG